MRAVKVISALAAIIAAFGSVAYYIFPQQTRDIFYTVINYNQTSNAGPVTRLESVDTTSVPSTLSPTPSANRSTADGYLRDSEPIQVLGFIPAKQVVCRGVTLVKSYILKDLTSNVELTKGFYGYQRTEYTDLDTGLVTPGELVEFNLQGNKQLLEYGFGFDDNHPSDPSGEKYAELLLIADGKVIDGPMKVRPSEAPVFRSVPVQGVFKLMFFVNRNDYELHPLVFDPVVK